MRALIGSQWRLKMVGFSVGENTGGRAMNVLESIQDMYPGQDCIALIQAGGDKCMNEGFCHGDWEWRPESGDVLEMKESRFGDRFDVGCKERVESWMTPWFADLWKWADGTAVNDEEDISNFLKQSLGGKNYELSLVTVEFNLQIKQN